MKHRDLDIHKEMKILAERKGKLLRLLRLRGEVSELERAAMHGTDAKHILKVILEEVCARYKTGVDAIMGPSREQSVVVPRQLVFYIGRELKIPLHQIGKAFQRDHTTVHFAHCSIKDRMETNAKFTETVNAVSASVQERLKKEEQCV